jgi:hypothetical protein
MIDISGVETNVYVCVCVCVYIYIYIYIYIYHPLVINNTFISNVAEFIHNVT